MRSLMKELDDISSSSVGDNELTALKRLKHDLELRLKEQVSPRRDQMFIKEGKMNNLSC